MIGAFRECSRAVFPALVLLSAFIATGNMARAEEPKVEAAKKVTYSGTFEDNGGRKGPIRCELTAGADEKWSLKINAKNEGSGPNKSQDFAFDLTGKKEAGKLILTGKPEVGRMGAYEITIEVTEKTFEGKFKGKSAGSMTLKIKTD